MQEHQMPVYVAPLQNVFQGIYQADWSVTDVNSASYVSNKPTNLSQFTIDLSLSAFTNNLALSSFTKDLTLSSFTNDLTSASIATQLGAATLTGTLTTRTGTTTAAPLVIPSGALLTTTAVGSVESDANALYHSHTTGATICRTIVDACQYFRTTATSAAITTAATNIFGTNAAFKASNFYEIEYFVIFTNTGAFAPSFGFGSAATTIYGELSVWPTNTTGATSSVTTYNAVTAKAISGGNAAGTFHMRFRGFVIPSAATLAPQISVATTGSLTILAGSHYKVFNRGV